MYIVTKTKTGSTLWDVENTPLENVPMLSSQLVDDYAIVESPVFEFGDAYSVENGQVTIDYDKAKEMHRMRFRESRKPILEKLDIEFMKALETGDTVKVSEIATKKQLLRDITNTELPNSLDLLLNTWPEILNENVN